jgi:hypothetical protein
MKYGIWLKWVWEKWIVKMLSGLNWVWALVLAMLNLVKEENKSYQYNESHLESKQLYISQKKIIISVS